MATKKHSASSNRWLREHFNDKYVQQARKEGLRSRAWFKLEGIQRSDKLFHPGMTVLDLGAVPGGWSQYAVTQIGGRGRVVACDILPMNPIVGVDFLQGNFCDPQILQMLFELVGKKKAQVVMSDLAPEISGLPEVDIPKSMYLVELALGICQNTLALGGNFLVKGLQGEGFNEYLREVRSLFVEVKIRKPDASRPHSREVYIVAEGYRL